MAKEEEFKYGIEALADALGVDTATARRKLRSSKSKKASNGKWAWKTKGEVDALVSELKSEKQTPAKKEKPEKAEKKKIVKKAEKKAPKKAGKKAPKKDA